MDQNIFDSSFFHEQLPCEINEEPATTVNTFLNIKVQYFR